MEKAGKHQIVIFQVTANCIWHRIAFVLTLLILWPIINSAQTNIDFQNFTQTDGLSSNYVLSFHQDHQGFMWIGTEGGLNRFDGQHFLEFSFDPENPKTLNDDWVTNIFEDSQHNLWVVTQKGLNILDRETGIIERIPLNKSGQKVHGEIRDIREDANGRLWANVYKQGLFELKKSSKGDEKWYTEYFEFDAPIQDIEKQFYWSEFLLATPEELWFCDYENIIRLDISSQELSVFTLPQIENNDAEKPEFILGKYVGNGKIMVLTQKTLFELDTRDKSPQIKVLRSIDYGNLKVDYTWDFFLDNQGIFLIPKNRDYFWYDLKTDELHSIRSQNQISKKLFPDLINSTYKDRQGNYWIGTAGSGLYLARQLDPTFVFFQNDPVNSNSVSAGQARTFLEDDRGNLWVGILNHGLDQFAYGENNLLQKKQSVVSKPNQLNALASNRIVEIIQGPEESIWMATLTHGLVKMDSSGQEFSYLSQTLEDSIFQSEMRIWALEKDQQGYIWVGTWSKGLFRIDPRTESIQGFSQAHSNNKSYPKNHIRYLFANKKGLLWVGTGGGLYRYDPKTQEFTHYFHNPNDHSSLSDNLVWAIYQDQNDDLWVGTNIGLNRFDEENQRFERFYKQDGLPDNTIYGILEDDEGVLWVSTENGLARQLPTASEVAFFSLGLADGLTSTSFIPKAYLNSSYSEHLFFGSTDGFLRVNPSLLQLDKPQPQLAIHAFSTFNPYEGRGELLTDYFVSDKNEFIKLSYKDQSITITLSDLNWKTRTGLRYDYQLLGFNQQWRPLDEDLQISFSNLTPGNYQLQARARNAENIASEPVELLHFRVYPPWWKSTLAYMLYVLFTAGIIIAIYRFQLRRQIEKQEAQNLKALDTLKNRLYTNITHELRTPLTIIKGMMGKINQNPEQWLKKGSKMISRNADELLSLVNQILDLRKLEAGKLEPKLVQGDILSFINYISESFHSMGADRNIQLKFQTELEELIMDYDPEMILRIISNLLSNAIKFSETGGEVLLQVATVSSPGVLRQKSLESLLITVKDEGIGIPEDQLPHIFDRFYQVDDSSTRTGEGTGIGLSLTRELIKLQGGKIEVKSKLEEGSSFFVWLPILNTAAPISQSPIIPNIPEAATIEAKGKTLDKNSNGTLAALPNLLIVEDNKDVRQYLTACLEEQYHLSYAADGEAGIEKALEEVPDIIISDVMMPKKDGYEVCDTLKKDVRTSHIPIILLTAKSDADSRISGLEVGADAYLAKPFNEKELSVRLEKLLEIRKTLQQRYQSIGNEIFSDSPVSNQEDTFILEIQNTIQQNLSDETFGITELCQALQISRAQLHNKLKALTGRSTSHYIRSIRIHQSKEMLINNPKLNISEIAFETGFSNLKYFSKVFTEEIGTSPSQYRKSLHSKG